MDSPYIKQTVCKVLNIFQHGKYLVAYVLKDKLYDRQLPVKDCTKFRGLLLSRIFMTLQGVFLCIYFRVFRTILRFMRLVCVCFGNQSSDDER